MNILKYLTLLLLSMMGFIGTPNGFADPDFRILSYRFIGDLRVGACNKFEATIQNAGDTATPFKLATHTLKIRHEAGRRNNFESSKYTTQPIGPMETVTLKFHGFPLLSGLSVIFLVLDEHSVIQESMYSNNTFREFYQVSEPCESNVVSEAECTLRAKFLSPSGYKQEGGAAVNWAAELENVGSGLCEASHVQLRRSPYRNSDNNRTVAIGNPTFVPTLDSGDTFVFEVRELFPPDEGQFLYKITSTGSLVPNSKLVLFE